MGIVVTTSNTNPIDLTASIIKAKHRQNQMLPCSVEWVVENSASINDYNELRYIASLFDEFNINVRRQEDIPEFNPSKKCIISLLKDILSYIDTSKGMVRIQHGAIVLHKDGSNKLCRYFGWKHGKLSLCDNKKKPTFYYVDENDKQKISLQGSMNLCLIKNYGELAHLPWYCIDSPIYPFEIEEVISPPEGCSMGRFDSNVTRLIPSGYSLCNYFSDKNDTQLSIEKLLHENGSVVSSRQIGGTRCSRNLLSKIARKAKNKIKHNGFYKSLCLLHRNVVEFDEIIIKLMEIWSLSQIMVSFDRGFLDEIRNTGLINDDNELEITKEGILNELIKATDLCLNRINSLDQSVADLVLGSQKPFGVLTSIIMDKALGYFNHTFYDFYYTNKATLPNILECISDEKVDTQFIDAMLIKRSSNVTHIVRGSIFEFEEFSSINSKLDNER